MRYPNLTEFIKYHDYHMDTFADFANISPELLQEVLYGDEELTEKELLGICKYAGAPFTVLSCPKLIVLDRDRWRHWQMMGVLSDMFYEIWEWKRKGSREASQFMHYYREDFVNFDLAFRNRAAATYGRYLGIKHQMEGALLAISCEQDRLNRKPRGLAVQLSQTESKVAADE